MFVNTLTSLSMEVKGVVPGVEGVTVVVEGLGIDCLLTRTKLSELKLDDTSVLYVISSAETVAIH